MTVDRRQPRGPARAGDTATDRRTRSALILHGPGDETQIGASEVAGLLDAAGWTTRLELATRRDATRTKHVDLVIGVDADIAAFRAAALGEAPVVTANSGDRLVIDHLLTAGDELVIRTSPIGIARIDRNTPTPIVQRAIVTAIEQDTELTWMSPIAQQLPLDMITNITVDVPEPMHRGPGSRSSSTAMGAVMTFRSGQASSSLLLHPDDNYTITTPDGSDIVIHIDQRIHHRTKRVHLGAHPVGLRVVHDSTGTTA